MTFLEEQKLIKQNSNIFVFLSNNGTGNGFKDVKKKSITHLSRIPSYKTISKKNFFNFLDIVPANYVIFNNTKCSVLSIKWCHSLHISGPSSHEA